LIHVNEICSFISAAYNRGARDNVVSGGIEIRRIPRGGQKLRTRRRATERDESINRNSKRFHLTTE
jgi:hypothetical protein